MPESDTDKQQIKEYLKDGIQEWLDAKFAEFGKWTMRGLVATVFAGIIYFWATTHGWTR